MRRRDLLRAGGALATLPLLACGSAPEPVHAGAAPVPPPAPSPPPSVAEAPAPPIASAEPVAAQPPAPAPPPAVDVARVLTRVGKNHGHAFTVPLADVLAGAEATYPISGTHPHAVTITAEQMGALRRGEILRVRSTETKGHAHRLWVRGAPAVDPPEWVTACKATFSGKDEHEIVVPAVDLASTAERTYDVQGLAGHTHQITLTAADFETLRKGGPVNKHTSREVDDVHLHAVTVELVAKRG